MGIKRNKQWRCEVPSKKLAQKQLILVHCRFSRLMVTERGSAVESRPDLRSGKEQEAQADCHSQPMDIMGAPTRKRTSGCGVFVAQAADATAEGAEARVGGGKPVETGIEESVAVKRTRSTTESLILAQDERWRRA